MVKQYQVVVDPNKLRAYAIPLAKVRDAIQAANQETGGSVVEMAEAEYMVRATGYIDELADLAAIPLAVNERGAALTLADVAELRLGPEMRRGVGEFDGLGDAVGGVVVMRWGGNALATIRAVEERLETLRPSLPEGVEIVTTYDRSGVIERAVDNLGHKLGEEFLVVVLVCAAFLLHLRSSLVILFSLPLGILAAVLVMKLQGVNANIMSLGGIAIAIGAMVDAAIVMIETMHRRMEAERLTRRKPLADRRRGVVGGRPGAVLLARHHHGELHAGVRAGGAGGPAVQAARVHQDLRDGSGRDPVDHRRPGADGLLHPRPDHARAAGTRSTGSASSSTARSSTRRWPGPGRRC